MKKTVFAGLGLSALLLFSACGNDSNDLVQSPGKDGSIETILSCEHKEGYDVLTTTHKVWVKNQLLTVISRQDTLPSLGNTMVSGEDGDGNTRNVEIPKEYEFFITVQ